MNRLGRGNRSFRAFRRGRTMQHVRLGNSGLKVSRLCLGCMTYGDPAWRPWVLDEARARPFIREALEAGIDFFDSADIYSTGESERILGARSGTSRSARDLVIAIRRSFPMSDRPNACGLSRKAPACQRGCLAAAVGYGLPGSLRDPSLRSGHRDRGNLRNPRQPGACRQGPLPRRLVDAGLALHEDARLPAPPTAWRNSMSSQYNLIVREDEEDSCRVW